MSTRYLARVIVCEMSPEGREDAEKVVKAVEDIINEWNDTDNFTEKDTQAASWQCVRLCDIVVFMRKKLSPVINVRLPQFIVDRIEKLAEKQSRSRSGTIRRIVELYIDSYSKLTEKEMDV